MDSQWWLEWYNLIYSLPFGMAALYLLAYSVSGVTFGDPDGDIGGHLEGDAGDLHADADMDADADLDADADVDADADLHADVDADADGHAHAGHAPVHGTALTPSGGITHASAAAGLHLQVLSWFGVGRAPLSILLMFLFFLWGFLGVSINLLLNQSPLLATAPWLVSLPIAAIGSVLGAKTLGGLVAKYVPSTETYVESRAALVGRSGDAVFSINDKFGMAFIRDTKGDGHQVACRVYQDRTPIEKGRRVLLVDYNSPGAFYYCIESDINV